MANPATWSFSRRYQDDRAGVLDLQIEGAVTWNAGEAGDEARGGKGIAHGVSVGSKVWLTVGTRTDPAASSSTTDRLVGLTEIRWMRSSGDPR